MFESENDLVARALGGDDEALDLLIDMGLSEDEWYLMQEEA